jgi:hypothetical protein
MTRPLALIEGDLTIPLPRPFDGLPPPFGSRRNVLREAVQRAVREPAGPARASLFPPGVKHVLFYKAPPQRVATHDIDEMMAEAKRYLEMGKVRPRSSRSDHALAAAIFAGCTIALSWLLVTCSMKDAEKAKTAAPTVLASASSRGDRSKPAAKPVVGDTHAETVAVAKPASPTIDEGTHTAANQATPGTPLVALAVSAAPAAPAAPNPVAQVAAAPSSVAKEAAQVTPLSSTAPNQVSQAAPVRSSAPEQVTQAKPLSFAVPKQVAPKQSVRVAAHEEDSSTQPAKPVKRVKVATLSETHVNERVALSRATHPATQPVPSTQPEWAAKMPHDDAKANNDAPWLNWSAQQQRPTMRAAVPVAGDNNWNDHMTQRRITDDPSAFHTDRDGQ